jgi:preprotein translocase subunit YajC
MNLYAYSFLLAQAPPTGVNPTNEMIKMILMIGVFGVLMYVLMIRPQQKRAKEQEAMLKTLKAGDKVVTTSGIIGVVIAVKDRTVSIRSADTKLEVVKSSIANVTDASTSDS